MKKIITKSSEETQKVAREIAKKFTSGVIALSGDLGAGKTTFTQGFAKALGIQDKIISPTFVLVRQHKIPDSPKILFHIDLYRLDEINFKETGIQEIIDDPNNIVLIEWAEKAKTQLPKDTLWIYFKNLDEDKRELIIDLPI